MGKKSKATSKKKSASKSGGRNAGGGCGGNSTKKSKKTAANPFGAEEPLSQKEDAYQKSIYHVYKAATLAFKEKISALVPKNIFKDDQVQSFVDAADYIKDNNILVEDDGIFRNLKLAISVRKKYSKRLLDGGDEGMQI